MIIGLLWCSLSNFIQSLCSAGMDVLMVFTNNLLFSVVRHCLCFIIIREKSFWDMIEIPLKIIQTSALLEIVHAAFNLVRSPVLFTSIQSRYGIPFISSSGSFNYLMGIRKHISTESTILVYESSYPRVFLWLFYDIDGLLLKFPDTYSIFWKW